MSQSFGKILGGTQLCREVIIVPDSFELADHSDPRHVAVEEIREAVYVADLTREVFDVNLHYVVAVNLDPMLRIAPRHQIPDREVGRYRGRSNLFDETEQVQGTREKAFPDVLYAHL